MNRLHRTVLTLLAAAPVLLAGSVITAPGALASVDEAQFSGGFHTACTLPYNPEGQTSGPYSCQHTATSLGCAAVADTGTVTAYAKICRADLTSGSTAGSATSIWSGYWTCANGAGTGTFRYQPSTSESVVFTFPVNLVVVEDNIEISGSYVQSGTGRTIVVRATMPAICTYDISAASGYQGAVTPA